MQSFEMPGVADSVQVVGVEATGACAVEYLREASAVS